MKHPVKSPVLVWILIFSFWPIAPASAGRCKTTWERTGRWVQFWKWGRPESPVAAALDADYSMELTKRIRNWGSAAGRTASHNEVKRSRQASFVLESLQFDRYFIVVEHLKPLFLELQLSYALYMLNKRMKAELMAIRDQTPMNLLALKGWAIRFDIEHAGLASALAGGNASAAVAAVDKLLLSIDTHSKSLALKIALLYDEYEASKSMLETCRKNGTDEEPTREKFNDHLDEKRAEAMLESLAVAVAPEPAAPLEGGETATPKIRRTTGEAGADAEPAARSTKKHEDKHAQFARTAEQARKVLERLETSKLLEGYRIKKVFSADELITPGREDFKQVLLENPDAADTRRRAIGNREFRTWLLSISPTDGLIDFLDRSASKLPYLNHPRFRAFLQYTLSETHIELYYPDIGRIVDSTASGERKLAMVEAMNAGTDDRFLVTLHRRIDARDEWAEMKTAAEARGDAGKHFLKRMNDAEVIARTLGDLNQWATDANRITRLFRRLFDAMLASGAIGGGGYGVYSIASPYLGDDTKAAIEEVLPRKKDDEPLTPEEEAVLEELKADASLLLKWLQENPEGQELFRKYLEAQKKTEGKNRRQEPVNEEEEPANEEPKDEPTDD